MKYQLPDPYDSTVEQWFAHMRIVLKAAEKTYQQMVIDHGGTPTDETGGHNPWLQFTLSKELREKIEQGTCPDVEEKMPKHLYIEIDRL